MHVDIIAEGWTHELDHWEKWMETRTFPMPYVDKKGKKHTALVPGSLRSRRIYTYVFPRGCIDMVLNTLPLEDCSIGRVNKKGSIILKTPFNILRKLLRLKKLPKPDEKKGKFPMYKFPNLRLVGLGYRDDIDFTNENGVTQEAL